MNSPEKNRSDWVNEEIEGAKRLGVEAAGCGLGTILYLGGMVGLFCWAMLCMIIFDKLRIKFLGAQIFLAVGLPGTIAAIYMVTQRKRHSQERTAEKLSGPENE